MQAKKLIEVAMPIKEISAESVRDKSIRHGHISTLHLWWARRPLPVCRAVIFASLVPDPLDNNCPQIFKEAIDLLLGKNYNIGDPYKPYDDIPFTSAVDKMEDNLRNRLIMFIGKFSEKYIQNERIGKETSSKDQISTFSLIKSESKNDKNIISKARKLIWVNHNAKNESNLQNSLDNYDAHFNKILEIDTVNFQAIVEPGVINEHFQNEVQLRNLFYPPDPASKGSCTLGGNVAHSSGGPRCVKYGTTRDYVLNLEVVLPTGEIIQTGANVLKNSTGYNITQLMAGSEGTLGIITKITLKLLPFPSYNTLLFAAFDSALEACQCVPAILNAGIIPSALEFMDKRGVELSTNAHKITFDTNQGNAYLLIEVDAFTEDQ